MRLMYNYKFTTSLINAHHVYLCQTHTYLITNVNIYLQFNYSSLLIIKTNLKYCIFLVFTKQRPSYSISKI